MNIIIEEEIRKGDSCMDQDLIDLGTASIDTKGGAWGLPDGGTGWSWGGKLS